MKNNKRVIKHLKGDIKTFNKEASEDRSLIRELSTASKKKMKKKKKISPEAMRKMKRVMHEFKEGDLHSGSQTGPRVTNPKQAVAIGYSEARRMKKRKK